MIGVTAELRAIGFEFYVIPRYRLTQGIETTTSICDDMLLSWSRHLKLFGNIHLMFSSFNQELLYARLKFGVYVHSKVSRIYQHS